MSITVPINAPSGTYGAYGMCRLYQPAWTLVYNGRLLIEMGVQGAVCILAAWTQYTCDFVACIPYLCIDPISMQFHAGPHIYTFCKRSKQPMRLVLRQWEQFFGFTTAPEA